MFEASVILNYFYFLFFRSNFLIGIEPEGIGKGKLAGSKAIYYLTALNEEVSLLAFISSSFKLFSSTDFISIVSA